jgi:cytochrome c oxidase assembly factor CtaG
MIPRWQLDRILSPGRRFAPLVALVDWIIIGQIVALVAFCAFLWLD